MFSKAAYTILGGTIAQQVRFSQRFPHIIWQLVSPIRRLLIDEPVIDAAEPGTGAGVDTVAYICCVFSEFLTAWLSSPFSARDVGGLDCASSGCNVTE